MKIIITTTILITALAIGPLLQKNNRMQKMKAFMRNKNLKMLLRIVER